MRTIFGTYPCARTRRTAPAAGARRGRGGRAGRATAWSERLEQARDGGDRVCAGAGGGRGRGARGRGRVLDGGPPAEQDVVHRRGEQGPVQGSSKASSQGSEPGVLTTPGGVRAAHEDARDAGRGAHLYSITSTVSKPPPLLEVALPPLPAAAAAAAAAAEGLQAEGLQEAGGGVRLSVELWTAAPCQADCAPLGARLHPCHGRLHLGQRVGAAARL